jgi:hypothetical protein
MTGHWFCHHCDDVVFIHLRGFEGVTTLCPMCRRPTASWIIHRPAVSATLAQDWFSRMRLAVNLTEDVPAGVEW